MNLVGQGLAAIGGLGSLVCFILVIVKMFQKNASGLAITCLVLALCCGIGGLVAFIYGWIRSREWGLTNVMTIWTVCVILAIIGNILSPGNLYQLQQFRP